MSTVEVDGLISPIQRKELTMMMHTPDPSPSPVPTFPPVETPPQWLPEPPQGDPPVQPGVPPVQDPPPHF